MNDFNHWNKLKKEIEAGNKPLNKFPKEGEVWMCSVGKNLGYEQNGGGNNFSRPMLIIKKFNNHMYWAISLSTKQKTFDFYFNFTDPNYKKVSVILAQLKLISTKRLIRKMYDLPSELFIQIKQKLQSFL